MSSPSSCKHLPCSILGGFTSNHLRQQQDGSYAAKLKRTVTARLWQKFHPRRRSDFRNSHTATFPVNQNKIISITRTLYPDRIVVDYMTYNVGQTAHAFTWIPSMGKCEVYNHKVVFWWSSETLEVVKDEFRFTPAVVRGAHQ